MQSKWRRSAHVIKPIALFLFTAMLAGCAGDPKCFPDGHCVEMPGYFGFLARWVGTIALGGIGIVLSLVTIQAFTESVKEGVGVGVFTLVLGGAAFWAYPGTTSPRARAEDEVRQYEARFAMLAREAEARAQETPPFQLQRARAADSALKKRREEMLKTQAKWQDELAGFRRELQNALARTGARSHEELLKKPNVPQQTLNLLNRAAHLRVLVAELDVLLVSADRTLVELEQQIWKLEKMVELNAVTTPEESAAIKRALASATELVRERTTAVNRADIAAEEAKLFREIVGGAK